jgi:CheY-like chemotaxis protein
LYGGTGLGLAIVKQLIEPQGGTIRVTSTIDQGSTFSFTLAFQKTNADAEVENDAVEINSDMENIKVLVVEDIALNQLLMKTLLDDFGFEIDIAENGIIAIEKLKEKDYSIVLMDLHMPEMNGFEATKYIRNTMRLTIPIIALTADVTTVDVAKCIAVGMDDYIAKPVDEQVLYKKIVRTLKKSKINKKEDISIIVENIKCINLEYLHHRTKSNPALMMEMISLYLAQTPPLITIIKQSLAEGNWQLLRASVHKMIPSFSIMGISSDFENMAKKIQELATTQEKLEGIQSLVMQLEEVCIQACIELQQELDAFKNAEN